MSDDVPFAQSFAWDSSAMENAQMAATRSLRKLDFIGSGSFVLKQESLSRKSGMEKGARNLLRNLCHQNGIAILTGGREKGSENDTNKLPGAGFCSTQSRWQTPKPVRTDDEMLNGMDGKCSLFASLLQVIEAEPGPVPTKQILRKLCLILRPADVPGTMDCKDMLLAVLHFLSSNYVPKSNDLLKLPLIKPSQAYGDLEKRNIEKVGDWKLDEIEAKLWRMEDIFLSSPAHWKWLRREAFCPRGLSEQEEVPFFSKGTIPLNATAKKQKGEGTRKRRTTSPSQQQRKRLGDRNFAVVAVATVDDTIDTGVDDPIVEATIIDDAF